jgi:predicted RNase H-like HicB family nuclease
MAFFYGQNFFRKENAMKYPVILFTGEDGWIIAECPALPGCVTQGETREEAMVNIREAIELTLEVRQELGWPVPEPDEVMSILDTAEVEL